MMWAEGGILSLMLNWSGSMARRGFFESRYSVCPTPPPGARTSGSGIKWGFRSVLDFLVECFRSYISPIRPWNCSPVYRRLKKKLLSFNGSKNLTFEGYSEKSTSPLAPSSKMIWNAYPSLYEEMAWWTEPLPVEKLLKMGLRFLPSTCPISS